MCLSDKGLRLPKLSAKSSNIFRRKGPKNPKRCHFMDAASSQKHLKIFNLTTANALLMKLTTIIYLTKTFNLAKDLGINLRA